MLMKSCLQFVKSAMSMKSNKEHNKKRYTCTLDATASERFESVVRILIPGPRFSLLGTSNT